MHILVLLFPLLGEVNKKNASTIYIKFEKIHCFFRGYHL